MMGRRGEQLRLFYQFLLMSAFRRITCSQARIDYFAMKWPSAIFTSGYRTRRLQPGCSACRADLNQMKPTMLKSAMTDYDQSGG